MGTSIVKQVVLLVVGCIVFGSVATQLTSQLFSVWTFEQFLQQAFILGAGSNGSTSSVPEPVTIPVPPDEIVIIEDEEDHLGPLPGGTGAQSSPAAIPSCDQLSELLYDAEENSCFICSYQDFPECGAVTAGPCHDYESFQECQERMTGICASIRIPETGLRECTMHEGACVSRFYKDCLDQVAARPGAHACLSVYGQDAPPATLNGCDGMELYYSGHSTQDQCNANFDQIIACFDLAPSCNNVTFTNSGCSSMANRETADAAAQALQNSLQPGQTAIVIGEQLMSGACTTKVTYYITCDEIVVTHDPCHYDSIGSDNFCYGQQGDAGKVSSCTNADGDEMQEVCCADNKFYSGTTCPMQKSTLMPADAAIQPLFRTKGPIAVPMLAPKSAE